LTRLDVFQANSPSNASLCYAAATFAEVVIGSLRQLGHYVRVDIADFHEERLPADFDRAQDRFRQITPVK
jgi:hypothetical protein